MSGSDGRKYVCKNVGEGLSDRVMEGKVEFGCGDLMMWGCMSWKGDGYVTKIDVCSLKSIINLPHVNNASNIVNICYSKLGWMITRRFEKVKMILRVNETNSYTTKACGIMYLCSRNTRVKQSNDVKGLGSRHSLHGGSLW